MALVTPRARVIIDNDFSGDPDDLFQTAHHLLCPSVEIPFIVASHLSVGDPWDPSTTQAGNAAAKADELLSVMGMAGKVSVLTGSELVFGGSVAGPQRTTIFGGGGTHTTTQTTVQTVTRTTTTPTVSFLAPN